MIAIVGGGLSGLATAYQLACEGIEFNLFEASGRLGGIVETVHRQGFVIECGPDSWVTEKPWARELAVELGLEARIISSNDQWRRTYVQQGAERNTQLIPIPDGMRMMVPARWGPLLESPLFSWQARLAYLREPKRAEELKASAPAHDESVADFVRRHFGDEVATTIAGPLLAAIFGGDIAQLSVRAVMPTFVRMEAEQGSLVQAVQRSAQQSSSAIFTTLVDGLETLIDRMVARLPPASLRLRHPVLRIERDGSAWRLTTIDAPNRLETGFDAVVLATPPNVTRDLLQPLSPPMAGLLPQQASSAIVVAFAFAAEQASRLRIPRGFGFVVPRLSRRSASQEHPLLACTFVDQKFSGRVPPGAALLRAFFGGDSADALLGETDEKLIERARVQLGRVLGPLPQAAETVVRRWPQSLPQYAVGHLDRMVTLESMLSRMPGLHLVGSAYYGVGLPDLIRQGRAVAQLLATSRACAGN
ncbi:MAG: protoporphyrinogen oxidase [Acidobacteriaceae bacterium]|jgi:oxygen-dependent protoporphyrinogen oxidase